MCAQITRFARIISAILIIQLANTSYANIQAQFDQAGTLLERGKYEQAETIYKKIVTDHPGTDYAFQAKEKLTCLYVNWSKDTQAQAGLDRLLKDFSKHKDIAAALWRIARQYSQAKKHERAYQIHKYNVENFPEDKYAMWSQVEIIYHHIRNKEDAAADAAVDKLLTVFSDQPTLPKEIYQAAMEFNRAGKEARAVQLHQYNVDTFPDYDDVYVMWSQVEIVKYHIRTGDFTATDTAYNTFLTVFFAQPTLATEICRVADMYVRAENLDKAERFYQYVLDNWLGNEQVLWAKAGLIKLDIARGNEAAAKMAIDSLIKDFDDHADLPKVLWSLAEIYYKKAFQYENVGQDAESKRCFAKVIALGERMRKQSPASVTIAQVYFFSAICYDQLGEYIKAVELYKAIVDNCPDYEYAWEAKFMIENRVTELQRWDPVPR